MAIIFNFIEGFKNSAILSHNLGLRQSYFCIHERNPQTLYAKRNNRRKHALIQSWSSGHPPGIYVIRNKLT